MDTYGAYSPHSAFILPVFVQIFWELTDTDKKEQYHWRLWGSVAKFKPDVIVGVSQEIDLNNGGMEPISNIVKRIFCSHVGM